MSSEAATASLPPLERVMTPLVAGLLLLPRLRSGMSWSEVYRIAANDEDFAYEAISWLERNRMISVNRRSMRSCVHLTDNGHMFQSSKLMGHRFGYLTALGFSERNEHGQERVWCYCSCGKAHEVAVHNLKTGNTRSCGCKKAKHLWKHGHAPRKGASSEYQTWSVAKARAQEQGLEFYWSTFGSFLRHLGKRPKGHVLTRVDEEKGWIKGNVIWATRSYVTRRTRERMRAERLGR